MAKGPLAGFPVVNFKFELQDGKYHDVDSSDMAFMLTRAGADARRVRPHEACSARADHACGNRVPRIVPRAVVGNISSRRGIMTSTETMGKMTQDHRRRAAGRDVRLLDRPALDDPRPGHVHDGVREVPPGADEHSDRNHRRAQGRTAACLGRKFLTICKHKSLSPGRFAPGLFS